MGASATTTTAFALVTSVSTVTDAICSITICTLATCAPYGIPQRGSRCITRAAALLARHRHIGHAGGRRWAHPGCGAFLAIRVCWGRLNRVVIPGDGHRLCRPTVTGSLHTPPLARRSGSDRRRRGVCDVDRCIGRHRAGGGGRAIVLWRDAGSR